MSIINLRGRCRCDHPHGFAGRIGCWLKKGHQGPHSAWIYRWQRKAGDARKTAVRLANERRESRNAAARKRRWNVSL
jgi:hypothetical protein